MPKIVDWDERRAHIISAMWAVAARDGVEAVSVRAVAREAGMSKTGLGHYFPTQGKLLAMAVEQVIEATRDRILELDLLACDVPIATDALAAMIPDSEERRRQSRVWLHLMVGGHTDPDLAEVLHHLNAVVRDGIHAVLEALAARGFVADGRDLGDEAAALHALIDGLSLHVLSDPGLDSAGGIHEILRAQLEQLRAPVERTVDLRST